MPTLFDPLRIGDLDIPNRIIMAPVTRLRAGSRHIPNALMAKYYSRRTVIAMLSAKVLEDDLAEAPDAGGDFHLAKPTTPARLADGLNRAVEMARAS